MSEHSLDAPQNEHSAFLSSNSLGQARSMLLAACHMEYTVYPLKQGLDARSLLHEAGTGFILFQFGPQLRSGCLEKSAQTHCHIQVRTEQASFGSEPLVDSWQTGRG